MRKIQQIYLGDATPAATPPIAAFTAAECTLQQTSAAEDLSTTLFLTLSEETGPILLTGGFGPQEFAPLEEVDDMLQLNSGRQTQAQLHWIAGQNDWVAARLVLAGKVVYAVSADPEKTKDAYRQIMQEQALPAKRAKTPPNEEPQPVPQAAQPPTESTPLQKGMFRQAEDDPRVKRLRLIQRIVLLLACLTFLFSAGYLVYQALSTRAAAQSGEQLAQIYQTGQNRDATQASADDAPYGKFQALAQINPDIIGWLQIPGTKTNNPVVRYRADDFYLDHDFYQERDRYGTLYLEENNTISDLESSENLSIYGHYMKNGTMLGELFHYRDLAFYKKHPTFTFDSIYKDAQWVVFAVFIVDATVTPDSDEYFEWRESDFPTEEAFIQYLQECKERSLLRTPVGVAWGEKLLTLTTCSSDYEAARLVVAARMVREGETVSVKEATVNPQPRYPQTWYDLYGGSPPAA